MAHFNIPLCLRCNRAGEVNNVKHSRINFWLLASTRWRHFSLPPLKWECRGGIPGRVRCAHCFTLCKVINYGVYCHPLLSLFLSLFSRDVCVEMRGSLAKDCRKLKRLAKIRLNWICLTKIVNNIEKYRLKSVFFVKKLLKF